MEVVRSLVNWTVKPPYVVARGLLDRTLERRAGIQTSGRVSLEELGLSSTERVYYEPAHWLALRRILSVHEIEPDDAFLDIGSGMGRVVYQEAARYPFRRVIGVELSELLHAFSVDNITRNRHRLRCTDVQLICADALDYEIRTVSVQADHRRRARRRSQRSRSRQHRSGSGSALLSRS